MRRGDGDETMDALEPAQPLDVIARDEAAHAEADEVEALAGREGLAHVGIELAGQFIEADLAEARPQAGGVDFAAVGAQVAGERLHLARVFLHAVDEEDGRARSRGRRRQAPPARAALR